MTNDKKTYEWPPRSWRPGLRQPCRTRPYGSGPCRYESGGLRRDGEYQATDTRVCDDALPLSKNIEKQRREKARLTRSRSSSGYGDDQQRLLDVSSRDISDETIASQWRHTGRDMPLWRHNWFSVDKIFRSCSEFACTQRDPSIHALTPMLSEKVVKPRLLPDLCRHWLEYDFVYTWVRILF